MATSPQGLFTGSLPEIYERFLVAPLFRPFAQELLARAGLAQDDRLLDVACGTGVVARLARDTVGDRGRVVGVDASPGMLAMAKSVAPAIDWRQGDAAHLPVASDETFDIVSCHQGLQFFPDKPAAAREMHRVLAPGGRVALGTWLGVEEIPLIRDLDRVAQRHVGPYVDSRHSFGDADAIRRLLADAGFRAIQVETFTRTIRTGDPATFPRLNTMAIVGMSAAAKAMSDEQRNEVAAAIIDDSRGVAERYLEGGELVWDLATTIAIART
jgi:ubiquinone/menaquinone biosynthesis C-methylase UbiE